MQRSHDPGNCHFGPPISQKLWKARSGCIDASDSESRCIFSIFRDLQDLHTFAAFSIQIAVKFRQTFSQLHSFIFQVPLIFTKSYLRFTNLMKFLQNFSIFYGNYQTMLDSQILRTQTRFLEENEEKHNFVRFRDGNCRIFQNIIFQKLETK